MKKTYLIIGIFLALFILSRIAGSQVFKRVRPAVVDLCRISLKAVTAPVRGIYNLATFRNSYERKIALLEKRLFSLANQSVRTSEILEENKRLRSLLAFKTKSASKAVAAEVIGRDLSNWDTFIIIDRGTRDGVRQNMVVAKDDGLIGVVFEAGSAASKVMLIDNPNSKVGVLIQRTREQGILVGLGGGLCKITYLSTDTDAKAGDLVITGEGGNSYLKGLLIGEVVKVQKDPHSLYASAIVRPSSNLFRIEEVLCIE